MRWYQNHVCKGFSASKTEELKPLVLKIHYMCTSAANQLLKRHWSTNEIRKPEYWSFPPPITQTHFPHAACAGRHNLCFDSAPCPALHTDWILPCLSFLPTVFHWVNSSKLEVKLGPLSLFSTSTSLLHPDWGWVFLPRLLVMEVSQGEGCGVGKVPVELGGHWGGQSAEKKKNQQR